MEDKKEYIQLWLNYTALFEPYSDGEVGRLVLAMMQYKLSGVEPGFTGNERYVWPAIKQDIDTATAKQAELTEKNRKNGVRGGRPAKEPEPTGLQKNPENPLGFLETPKAKIKKKTKKKIKEKKIKEKILPPSPSGGLTNFGLHTPENSPKPQPVKHLKGCTPTASFWGLCCRL